MIVLIGCSSQTTKEHRKRIGKVTAEFADLTYLTADNPGRESAVKITAENEEGRTHYVLHGAKAKFRVADTSDGTGLILKMLVENGYIFEGGVILTSVEDYGPRIRTKTAGTVEIQYVMYGDQLVSG